MLSLGPRDDWPDSEIALDASNVSVWSSWRQLPGELVAVVLQHLCEEARWIRDSPRGTPALDQRFLGLCSLTCRRWAEGIRPVLFSEVILDSGERARAFSVLLRSPVAVPKPLRTVVRKITLVIRKDSRPWMYHVWVLFRNGILPIHQPITLDISCLRVDQEPEENWNGKGDESILDVGFPRKLPSMRPIRLRTFQLNNLRFRSHETLLSNSFTYYCPHEVILKEIQWPKNVAVSAPAGHLLARLSSHTTQEVLVRRTTAISPLIWSLITPHEPTPGITRQLLYVNGAQIDAVMGIFRLFSDECECWNCKGLKHEWAYRLQVHAGTHPPAFEGICSPILLDPADATTRYLRLNCLPAHIVTVEVQPIGTISRVCLAMEGTADLVLPSNIPTSAPTPVIFGGMLKRFDDLCALLDDTVGEVVIAIIRPDDRQAVWAGVTGAERAMYDLRDQMPSMARRQRLVFRLSKQTWSELHSRQIFHSALEGVFEHDGRYWTTVTLDD